MAEIQTKSKSKVSVVIPAYNEELVLETTLETLLKQDYKEEFEIIVCNNNSTDRTAEIAAKMGAKVILETRKGTRFAYDAGMRAAVGDLILVTNADVHLPSNWISRIVQEYEDPEVVGVGTKVTFYNAPDWINFIFATLDTISPKHAMWGPSLSCRRDVYLKVGGFNHGVNTNEDAIFTLLIEKLGKVKIINDVVAEMDGRRFNGGFVSACKQWLKSYGLNSIYIQFNYLLFGEIKTLIRDFGDVRSTTFGQGEQVQLSVIIPAGNDQEHISRVLSDLQTQTFDKRFRVYVLNDSSTDLTMQIARLFPSVTAVNYPGVYDLGIKLKLLLNEIQSPVVAFTSPIAHLPEDWLTTIFESFNRERKKQLQVLSGPYINELSKVLSSITNQTLDRMSSRVEFANLAILTSLAKETMTVKGGQEEILKKLDKTIAEEDVQVNFSPNFKATFVNEEVLGNLVSTSATSVKHTFKKLFKLQS